MRERSHGTIDNQPAPAGTGNPKLPTELAAPLGPFEEEDVQSAFEAIIKSRGGDSNRRVADTLNKSPTRTKSSNSNHHQSIIPRYDSYQSPGEKGLGVRANTPNSVDSFDDTDNIGGGGLGERDRSPRYDNNAGGGGGGGGREMGGSYGGRDGGSGGGGGGGVPPPYMPPKAKAKTKTIVKVLTT